MLELPDDLLCNVLGRTDGDVVTRFAQCSSLAAAAVRANREGLLACRGPRWGGHGRVLDDARPVSRERRCRDLAIARAHGGGEDVGITDDTDEGGAAFFTDFLTGFFLAGMPSILF